MIARLVLAYILALPFIVPRVAATFGSADEFRLAVRMTATGPGLLQVFYDSGSGFNETESARVPVEPVETEEREYIAPLPRGRYRSLRIDPGLGAGTYTIARIEIRRAGGQLYARLPLDEFVPLQQLVVIERSRDRLAVEAPAGSNDPILIYTPAAPLTVALASGASRAARQSVLIWLAMLVIVMLGERVVRLRSTAAGRWFRAASVTADANPRSAIAIVALLATAAAMYPVLFFGRSLVSPNNHGFMNLYEHAPFVYGSSDMEIEDVRGSDVVTMSQNVPHSNVQRMAIANGEWPFWNRYSAFGRPLFGQGMDFVFDPLHWLMLLAPDLAAGWDAKFAAHRFVFAVGTGLASFAATGAWLPSAIAAAASAFGGVYAHRLNHPTIFSLTAAPWVLLGWFLLARAKDRRERIRAGVLLAVALAFELVASPPKDAFVSILGMTAAGISTVLLSSSSVHEVRLKLAAAVWAGASSLLMTAPHWLIFFATLKNSVTFYDGGMIVPPDIGHAVGLFVSPLIPGNVVPGLHLLALTLTISALGRLRVRRDAAILWATATVAAVLISVAFGAVPAPWLMRIPLVREIAHVQDTFLTAALPLLLVLSAIGAQALLTLGARHAVIVTLVAGLTTGLLAVSVARMASLPGFEAGAVLLLLPIVCALPACLFRLGRQTGGSLWPLVTGVAVIVLLLPGGLHFRTGVESLDRLLIQPRPRVPLGANSPAVDVVNRASTEPFRTAGVHYALFSGTQALYELEGVGGSDPLELPHVRELSAAAGVLQQFYWITIIRATDFSTLRPFLDLANVGFVLGPSSNLPAEFVELPAGGRDYLKAFRRPTPWPRAFFAQGVTTYSDAADLLREVERQGGPFAGVQLSDHDAVRITEDLGSPSLPAIAASDYQLTVNTTSFRIRAPRRGVAVLTESYGPNSFRATLNGKPVEYFRVNHAFKGIRIPGPGDWEVRFEYRPALLNVSLAISAVGMALLAGGCWFGGVRYRAARAESSEYPAARASS